jgi:hypothetical protein
MCTVSVIRLDRLEPVVRLVCSRDERCNRAAAVPPRQLFFGDRRAVMPVDPVSGGTWIAVNDAGLVMTLLNHHPPSSQGRYPPEPVSRGRIIPSLLHHKNLHDALEEALAIPPGEHQPFRLLMLDAASCCQITSNGHLLRTSRWPLCRRPLMWSSSSLGDHLVEQPRRGLFQEMVRPDSASVASQDAFHAHIWPGREHLSVRMSRQDARTVSLTTIELGLRTARMRYVPWQDPSSQAQGEPLAARCGRSDRHLRLSINSSGRPTVQA